MRLLKLSVILISISAPWINQGAMAQVSKRQKNNSSKQLQQRIEELEQKQKILERNLELKEEQEKEQAKTKPIIKANSEGFSISSADGNNEFHFRGLLQVDARFYLDQDGQGAVDTFLIRRARPTFEGKFFKRFEFKIMPDFGEGKVQLVDAYIDTLVVPGLKIRVGKFKEPVGLERLESASALHFVERALPTDLVPNRDIGVMAHGKLFGGSLEYELGVFNGVPDGASADFDINNSKDIAGRLFAHPFKTTSVKPLQGLGIGVSATIGRQAGNTKNTQLPSYKTPGQQIFFEYVNDGTAQGTAIAQGNRWHVSPQGYYYWKGFGLLGEYVASSQEVELDGDGSIVLNTAWQIAASYVIGADNSYGNIKPRRPLGWKKGGTGAFEFAARYNELSVDPDAFPLLADPSESASQAKGWGVGFNWIVNDNIKFMLDFDQTHFVGGAPGGGNRRTEHVILNRYQVSF